ncbi:MAG: hypothetical protein JW959_08075 [Pirellulales bacterium]|nr:hypothetical protein [Pirellulales bacterium]
MFNLLFADSVRIWSNDVWYALPAIAAISLVYAATRHERMRPIWLHAARVAGWIVGFMIVVGVALEWLSWMT